MKKLFLPLWITGAILLFLYSYTQVDLSLTLSRASVLQDIQKAFQYIGWFNRPLSAILYIGIFFLLFSLYLLTIKLVQSGKVSKGELWKTIIIVAGILTFSYNAFSYDLFNYIFDAKIITFYNLNPYFYKALDFPNDPMLSFMHWTHRTYPYGPFWLVLTVPISYLGGQIFIVTFFMFKLLISSFFLLTVLAIGKLSSILKLKNTLLPIAVFALNPYVILESLVSSHNDIVMMGLLMIGISFLIEKKRFYGWGFIVLSIATKFATGFVAILYPFLKSIGKEKNFIPLSVVVMLGVVALASFRTNYQPWYLLYVVPISTLISHQKYIFYPMLLLTIANISYYLPYLYTGNWEAPIPGILNLLIVISLITSIIMGILLYKKNNS